MHITKNFIWLVILVPIFLSCEKDTTSEDLKGDLIGIIYTSDEFGFTLNDRAHIKVTLDGSEPLLETYTDSLGNYKLKDIPSGTYNLVAVKEGYGEYQYQGIQITGGPEPRYFGGFYLYKNSSTIIEDISVRYNSTDNKIYLSGNLIHSYSPNKFTMFENIPQVRYFIHTSGHPSSENYLYTRYFQYQCESGSNIEIPIYINEDIFPSGTTIYVVAYGCNEKLISYYDIQTNQKIYPSLGKASNIASIVVP